MAPLIRSSGITHGIIRDGIAWRAQAYFPRRVPGGGFSLWRGMPFCGLPAQRPGLIVNESKETPEPNAALLEEAQLLLSEKRTALSTLRTGIAIFALPLSVFSVLIATSRSYDALQVLYWIVPLLLLNLGLIALAVYLIVHSIRRLHHYDFLIRELKRKHSRLAELID